MYHHHLLHQSQHSNTGDKQSKDHEIQREQEKLEKAYQGLAPSYNYFKKLSI